MNAPRWHGLAAAVLFMVMSLGYGCVQLAKSFPEKHYYAIELSPQSERTAPTIGSVLKIRKLRVSPQFEGKELVYRTKDVQFESDFYNEWFVQPNAMLTQQLQNWLAYAGPFQYVVDTSSALEATHILEGSVTGLYGDYRNEGRPRAILEVQMVLIKDRPSGEEILFRGEYSKKVDMPDQSPDALTKGWTEGLRQLFTALAKDIQKVDLNTTGRRETDTPPRIMPK